MARLLKAAKLKVSAACIEDINWRASRGLDKSMVTALAGCDWLRRGHSLLITGATGCGKTWLACALAHQAARSGFSVLYTRAARLFEGAGGARTVDQLFEQIDQLSESADDRGQEILGALYDYAESIARQIVKLSSLDVTLPMDRVRQIAGMSVPMLRNAVAAFIKEARAAGLAVLVYLSGHTTMNNGLVAEQVVRIASAKCAMPLQEAFLKGVLCNLLVCMAVWMATAGRGVADKVVAIVFPISAFVASRRMCARRISMRWHAAA